MKTALVVAVAVLLVAACVAGASLLQAPTYEASAHVLVSPAQEMGNGKIQLIPNAPAGETPGAALTQTMAHAIDSRPVAEEVIRRLGLGMAPSELLDNLAIEHVEGTSFIRLTYEGTNSAEATDIVNTMAEASSERITDITRAAGSDLTATVWDKARVPDYPTPVSPNPLRRGILTLVIGLVLCVGTVVVRPGVGARVADTLGERPPRQGVGQAGVLGRRHSDYSIVERVKEKKLLRALGRRGKLTAVEAALESELSVEEANRMLFELAARGHLEVTVAHGRLLYSFWDLAEGEDGA